MSDRRSSRRVSRIGVAVSLGLHAVGVGLLAYFAAREGMLGSELRRIVVSVVPKKLPAPKPASASLPAPPPPPAAPEPPPATVPAPNEARRSSPTAVLTPELSVSPAARPTFPVTDVAPGAPSTRAPSAVVTGFSFGGGQVATADDDPRVRYRSWVESRLRAVWQRPEDVADSNFLAEVELAIDATGTITGSEWKRGSGHRAWDDSVRRAVARTRSVGRPPPREFPRTVLVRFDVGPDSDSGAP